MSEVERHPCPPECPGWVPFGTHANTEYQGKVFFAGEDEALMPVWERHAEESPDILTVAKKMRARYEKHLERMGDQ